MATTAQLEANRLNARKSTGPRSAEGKDASRRNALKHGLAAEALILPDEEADALSGRVAAWLPALDPRDDREIWLVEEVALCTIRIDRCRALDEALRSRSAARASSCWDADREAEAEELGRKLSRSPSLVLHQLRRSKQGCAWLLARWQGLGRALENTGAWTDAQKKLALDLLGTPKEFREVPGLLDGDRCALVAEQIAQLDAWQAGPMADLDDLDRAHAEVGLGRDLDKPLNLVRRYEAACVRRMEKALKAFDRKQRPAAVPEVRTPVVTPIPVNAPQPALITPPPPIPQSAPASPVPNLRTGEERRVRRAKLAKLLGKG